MPGLRTPTPAGCPLGFSKGHRGFWGCHSAQHQTLQNRCKVVNVIEPSSKPFSWPPYGHGPATASLHTTHTWGPLGVLGPQL